MVPIGLKNRAIVILEIRCERLIVGHSHNLGAWIMPVDNPGVTQGEGASAVCVPSEPDQSLRGRRTPTSLGIKKGGVDT